MLRLLGAPPRLLRFLGSRRHRTSEMLTGCNGSAPTNAVVVLGWLCVLFPPLLLRLLGHVWNRKYWLCTCVIDCPAPLENNFWCKRNTHALTFAIIKERSYFVTLPPAETRLEA